MLKKIIVPGVAAGLVSIFAIGSVAEAHGFYVGGQIGAASLDNASDQIGAVYRDVTFTGGSGTIKGITLSRPDTSNSVAGRIFGGYQFTRYFGFEAGYAAYNTHDLSVEKMAEGFYSFDHQPPAGLTDPEISKTFEVSPHVFDVLATATLPFDSGFSLFAKGGIAYGKIKYSRYAMGSTSFSDYTANCFSPEVAFGAGFYD